MKSTRSKQSSRILDFLLDNRGQEVSSVVLHRVGSGKPDGWLNSLTRRISDVRSYGYQVVCRKEQVGTQVFSYYTLV